jgi:alpha-tubulin suppressor-like RCC1 family protein
MTPLSAGPGATHSLVIDSGGAVWGWGENSNGQIGDTTTIGRSAPVSVALPPGTAAVQVATGGVHSLAVLQTGAVATWGGNASRQLGNGTTTANATPTVVSGLSSMVGVAGGLVHSVALSSSGTVYTWGDNAQGALCDGSSTNSATPIIPTGTTATKVVAGGHHTVLFNGGVLYTCGNNSYGQLGRTTWPPPAPSPNNPVAVSGSYLDVAAGIYHTLAINSGGGVTAWGLNNYGQLGDGTTTTGSAHVTVSGLSNIVAVSAGYLHSLALKNDGTVYAWGNNGNGQVGNGGPIGGTLTPVAVMGSGSGVVAISATMYGSMAMTGAGDVYTWGLAPGRTGSTNSPAQVTTLSNITSLAKHRHVEPQPSLLASLRRPLERLLFASMN